MGNRKRFSEMTMKELQEYEDTQSYHRGRSDAFGHGNPETIKEYWDRSAPTHDELLLIVRNILNRLP